jgi:hypothetical protein
MMSTQYVLGPLAPPCSHHTSRARSLLSGYRTAQGCRDSPSVTPPTFAATPTPMDGRVVEVKVRANARVATAIGANRARSELLECATRATGPLLGLHLRSKVSISL